VEVAEGGGVMAALRVLLACTHALWPTGSASLYRKGETAYCKTCRKQQEITDVERVKW
jgi:hypothetical protein